MYDLLQSSVIPVANSRLPELGIIATPAVDGHRSKNKNNSNNINSLNSGALVGAIYSVSYNPRQRDLLATGDSCGRVMVWRVSWRLANKRPGEEEGIERLFKGSLEEVKQGLWVLLLMSCAPPPHPFFPSCFSVVSQSGLAVSGRG